MPLGKTDKYANGEESGINLGEVSEPVPTSQMVGEFRKNTPTPNASFIDPKNEELFGMKKIILNKLFR